MKKIITLIAFTTLVAIVNAQTINDTREFGSLVFRIIAQRLEQYDHFAPKEKYKFGRFEDSYCPCSTSV